MTLLPDVPSGATWRCVDLHLHTPGVHTFALPGGTDERNEAHRITVLPGAEMSIDNVGKGLHLLLVCDEDSDPERKGGEDAFRRRAEKYGGLDDA
ncbi:MAG: hypothetical protein LC700_00140 [Actinobacteria bacterium]|nr:hypothetical protein [Actinomycetota bacterium]